MNQRPIINDAGELVGMQSTDPAYGQQPTTPITVHRGINTDPRKGKYMHTSNGRKYWPLDPRPEEVHIEVVAHHLATRCRYNGATQHPHFRSRIFYSVAEHSVLVSRYMVEVLKKPEFALEALLHDGSEAYNGDLIRPLKYDPLFREPFKIVEDLNESAGAQRFNLVYPYPPEVKKADEAVTAAEMGQIIPRDPSQEWTKGMLHDDSAVAPYQIEMLEPFAAKEQFLMRFEELMRERSRYAALPQFSSL